MASRVVMILSAGRCGTQWLADSLDALYRERMTVTHEPLGPLYRPRRFFRRYDDPAAILALPEVARHVAWIEEQEHYVETGWPLFPVLPLLHERLGERLRVVHLTRHPVPSALSHLAHNSYAGSARDDEYTRLATLGPRDANVFQRDYAARWPGLSAYEKCLFWWTEVNAYALELARRLPSLRLLRIRSEDMLGGETEALADLLAFAGLAWDERIAERRAKRVDRWRHHTDQQVDPAAVLSHPLAVATAAALGYDAAEFQRQALAARYAGAPDAGSDRFGRFS